MRTSIAGVGVAIVGLVVGATMSVTAEQAARTSALARATSTFTKDVAPILYKNCTECHRPSMFAPMSLMTYEDARPWARAIKQRVVAREMPPWHADPAHGTFKNDPSLSQKDIDTIVAWVDAGAPRGNESDLPPAPQYPEGWTIGEPDAIFTMTEEYTIPAEGTIPYMYFRIPTNLTEDKYIKAIEIRPGNRAVVHHVIANAQPGGLNPQDERARGRIGLGGTTPNKPGHVYEEGVARRLPAGSDIVLQMHYTTMGVAARDRTSLAVKWATEPPTKVVGGGNAMNVRFAIPPGAANHEVTASRTFTEDTYLTTMTPHMHVRGKDMKYVAYYPDGRQEILLSVPKYDFNWQHSYELAEPKLLPKGTKLEVIAHFDNSTNNLFNPDPTATVRWGDQTWEEMMIGFYGTVVSPVRSTTIQQ
ncbi:MAG: thiol-disulfide isomerase [Acidobacteriota bacterium]